MPWGVKIPDLKNNPLYLEPRVTAAEMQMAEIAKVSSIGAIINDLNSYTHIKLPSGTFQIDLTLPDNIILEGNGDSTWIQGEVKLGSNSVIRKIKFGYTEKRFTFKDGATNSNVEKCHFVQGLSSSADGGAIHANGISASNIVFRDCLITDALSNGVKLVDKGTPTKHFESIQFINCQFYNNAQMNFEVFTQQDGANPITTGYRNINLIGCTFKGRTSQAAGMTTYINVSYDSQALTDGTGRNAGYSTVRDCVFTDGFYCLEMAGAIQMTVENNTLTNGTSRCVSTSQMGNVLNGTVFKDNKINSSVPAVFQGQDNFISNNRFYFGNGGYVNLSVCERNIFENNIVDSANVYALTLETSPRNMILSNYLSTARATSNSEVILLVYASTTQNTIKDNKTIKGTGGVIYSEQLGALLNKFINNFTPSGAIQVGNSAYESLTLGITGGTNFSFSITNKRLTGQTPLILKIRWVGRLNNTPQAGEIMVAFQTFDQSATLPVVTQSGLAVTVTTTTNGDSTTTFTIASAASSLSSWGGTVELFSSNLSDWGY